MSSGPHRPQDSQADPRAESYEPASDPVATVFAYHERTKHQFDRYARALGYLDWANQPCPFRRYSGTRLIHLPLPEQDLTPGYDAFFAGQAMTRQAVHPTSLSAFFYFALALSAWKRYQQNRWSLRVNPSSGNLHPTECYLIANALPGFTDLPGVYHYAPLQHQLECRATLTTADWQALMKELAPQESALPDGTFLVALSSIHWREAWKYGERAYRYCQHDCGHALAALTIAAGLQGWQLQLVEGISDRDLATLMGLDRMQDGFHPAEVESPDLLAVVTPVGTRIQSGWSPSPGMINTIANAGWHGQANTLSDAHHPWPWIDKVAQAALKPKTDSNLETTACNESDKMAGVDHPPEVSQHSDLKSQTGHPPFTAGQIIRQRRSALDMDGSTQISRAMFYTILNSTLPLENPRLFSACRWPPRVHLGLFVHRVAGLPPGLYALLRDVAANVQLRDAMNPDFIWRKPTDCPQHLPLYCLCEGDAREVSELLSCHQSIASGGVFSCAMLAEFEQPIRTLGPWWYRRLFWETGMIGQMLYLEAEASGIRATGIGCYFDDPVHQLFGINDRSFQSLYHFTMGGPVEDTRLETRAAYETDCSDQGEP
ncbi:SagB/ThcOx family dehydrogenase [Photobacterium sp. MCCC 1A19761]|uniref:SagB/ThcOx family dehydrogenase n=1 Tax=Photobacterium sp. MCCC 1A19761 TaxID=3115000 RepID=UPI00307EE208